MELVKRIREAFTGKTREIERLQTDCAAKDREIARLKEQHNSLVNEKRQLKTSNVHLSNQVAAFEKLADEIAPTGNAGPAPPEEVVAAPPVEVA